METLWRDVRYALRSLARSPGFAFAAILAMTVGIGANTANFSLFDAILLRPIPVPHFGRLVLVNETRKETNGWMGVSFPDFQDWGSRARSFAGLAARRARVFDRTGQGPAEQVDAEAITPNFFQVLGTKPSLGRSFTPEESVPGRNHVAILSYRYWQSGFAGDRGVLGRAIELDHAAYTVVGVMPRDIEYPLADLFVPLALTPAQLADRGARTLDVLGRLEPGASLAQTQADLATISAALAKTYPATNQNVTAYVRSMRVTINGNLSYYWGMMFAVAMGLVLLIACANVANLQLARGTARQKEIALRAALGAPRRAVVRQLIVESLLTALMGAVGGILLAEAGVRLIVSGMPTAVALLISGWDRISVSPAALVFTIGVAVLAGIVSGVLPAAYSSKPNLNEVLKQGGRSATPGHGHGWIQAALVVAQMSLALVLLVATALLVRGFRGMATRQEQFAPSRALLFHVELPTGRYQDPADRLAFYQQALAKLRTIPGASAATVFTTFPLSNDGGVGRYFEVFGRPEGTGSALPVALTQSISPGFFALLHIPFVAGRDFSAQDGAHTLPVAVVNRKLAQRYWPHESAIGRQVRLVVGGKPGPWLTVVGVVGDVLWDWTDQVDEAAIFQPYSQAPRGDAFFALRTGSEPDALVPTVREEMASLDPDLPLTGATTRELEPLSQAIHESTAGLGVIAGLMGALGFIAFALAAIGVYSVMAYSVTQRRHEIGVRMALGADAKRVLALMLRRSALLLAIGVAIGLPVAYALARLLGGLFFGVNSTDPLAFGGAISVLAAAALLAGYLPARQAARLDPVDTLRAE
jgi:putative ABC transport system permease protein